MAKATSLTRKGQVTIPKTVREHLGLKPFDKIEFLISLSVEHMRRLGLTDLYSYDRDFDRISSIRRLEP